MKTFTLISGTLLAGLLFASGSAMAEPTHRHGGFSGINTVQLDRNIDRGVRSGDLTRAEEKTLRTGLRSLVNAVHLAKKDNRITARERANLERKESQLKRSIYRLSNNRDVASRDHRNNRDHRSYNNNRAPQPHVVIAPMPVRTHR
ncbi:hypothetical protein [Candidatus Thiothrix anitrata]|jgi:hypothetical protein|uniref:Uncharacterized protein n=1 Tax=Candidatus Thiothrix anitrata TaxID=2823902 RepID=A0ABX7X450_9GAMM|nr:hypothetical protein [Candidatus Thiothrix anitrata]QTR50586.1 hypothetical protein J8380_03175 [Candidatus Thiothrix anitrata]